MKVKKTAKTTIKKKNSKDTKGKKKSEEPVVKVLNLNVNPENPRNGFFELDWNEYFVQSLKLNGYRGATDEEVVDKWFQDLCRNVASESGTEDVGASGYVNKVLRDDGKTEVS